MSRGGIRSGAGRKPGVPNKVTAEVRELALRYAPAAISELARLARSAESEAVRVTAIKELLDRAYGKSRQAIVGDEDRPLVQLIIEEPRPPSMRVVSGA